jgi:hypothetical protein
MYNAEDIVERLERRFHLGTNPTIRRALYHRLGKLVEELGDVAYYVIAETAADALGKDDPAKFFCKIVLRRLIERGVLKPREL